MIMYKNDQRANQRHFYKLSSTHFMLYNCSWMTCGSDGCNLCGRSCNLYIVRLGGTGGQFLLLRCNVSGLVAIDVAAAVVVGMIAAK